MKTNEIYFYDEPTGENFCVEFYDLTEEEQSVIRKIVIQSSVFGIGTVPDGSNCLSFQSNYCYSSYKRMYEDKKINPKIIKELMNRGVILSRRNLFGNGLGIYHYLTPVCTLTKTTATRFVIIEKTKIEEPIKTFLGQILDDYCGTNT